MNGPEHYYQAEVCLGQVQGKQVQDAQVWATAALAHAALAQVAMSLETSFDVDTKLWNRWKDVGAVE